MPLTGAQLEHILHVYSTESALAARELAPIYGIKASYVRDLAKRHKVKVAPHGKRSPPRRSRDSIDPRWNWAIERGAVIWP